LLTFFRISQWASDTTYWSQPPWGLHNGYQDFWLALGTYGDNTMGRMSPLRFARQEPADYLERANA
jgi:hypothetical protein